MLMTPGRAVYWILPEAFAPSMHVLKDNKRGDMGTFVLQPGIALQGKVLDAAGQADAWALRRRPAQAERDARGRDHGSAPRVRHDPSHWP